MFLEGEALGYEMVIHQVESASGKKIDRGREVAYILSTMGKCSGGEAKGGDMRQGGGENG